MTPALWRKVNHFKPSEKWGDPNEMNSRLIFELDAFRAYIKKPIIIHCGFERRYQNRGQHPIGTAVDCHIHGLSLIDQFIAACRFQFVGIGVYPCWNFPGLHLDMRINVPYRQLWGSTVPRKYVKLNKEFFKKIL